MVDVAYYASGCITASKDVELHMACSKRFESGIYTLGSFTTEIFSQIATKCKINDRFVLRCVPQDLRSGSQARE